MDIKELTAPLQLGYIGSNFDQLVKEAVHTKMKPDEFMMSAFTKELEHRRENRVTRRIREAKFPYKKYLVDLDLNEYSDEVRKDIEELTQLDFITNQENAIMIANSGRGKSHLAIGLGIAACLADMRVLFFFLPNLVIELKEAMSRNAMTTFRNKFMKFELVIIDELGYVSFDAEGCDILFNLISNRLESGSMIITTNLEFKEWVSVFKDKHLTGALVDRVARRAYVMDMSGASYRFKETKNWLQKKGKRTVLMGLQSGPIFDRLSGPIFA
jgi:DNA replication protein DnaC